MADVTYNKVDGSFTSRDDVLISYESWIVEKPKGIVVLTHGLGEHSGRFANLIEKLNGKKISFYALNLRGHGMSEGKPGHVESFLNYTCDLKNFTNMIKDSYPTTPLVMVGNGMGGVVVTRYALMYPADLNGFVLISPLFQPMLKALDGDKMSTRYFSRVWPSITKATGLLPEDLSHDEDVVADYVKDEMKHNRVSRRLITELVKEGAHCIERGSEIDLPVLALHGGEDKISNIEGTKSFINSLDSIDKDIEIFEDLYHDLINETEKGRTRVLSSISKWILSHFGKQKKESNPSTTKNVAEEKVAEKPAASSTSEKKTAKKPAAKKATKKATKKPVAKKTAKKTAAKKTAKKATAKKTVKKATAKKAATKKVAKKATAKKTVKKAATKKTAKKSTAKKAAVKKTAKKSSTKKK